MHEKIRDVYPKKVNLYNLGLVDQDSANLLTSHINYLPYEKLNGKSPIELMEFLSSSITQRFLDFGIAKLPADKVTLKPYLLKK